ncbi:AMP-dependent synthetase [Mycolicibacterium chitae]|uniref:Long-chain-fatty-acid--CoA ligase FadD13 n=1 Tax=Mycolicibacterium chitae TaxID=1792 RepID=A0A448I1X4_MYCCI|nr:AMP-binding protein [Mycolicibacterium chitae]MCV7106245.1 AMP-binding protein [Mycolicibacterium chitae]BBZ03127.1 AMP-dependent synthetase [Mycolicibacterium chitae]VEG46360.1 AMP-dependent synthetase and ligase [Mycolicibacterium chitae]
MPVTSPTRLHDLIAAAAAAVPERPAVVVPDGPSVTFAEFDRRITEIAEWVGRRSRPGDRIAVIADNGLDYAGLYYGVPRGGRVLALINQRLSAEEQLGQLAVVDPAVVLGDAKYLSALGAGTDRRLIAFDDAEWSDSAPAAEDDGANNDDANTDDANTDDANTDDAAWLLFTTGSTGAPKGVVHSHRSLLAAVSGTVAGRAVAPGGVYLLPFPMCHIAGYNLLVQHAVQATVLPVAAYRPESFAAVVDRHGVTSCSLAPTMLHSLLEYLERTGATLPTLRDIAYGSAAIPADLLRRAMRQLDAGFHQGYGMTETGGNLAFLGPDEHRAGAQDQPSILASTGRPHPGVEVRLGDDGEILVRGPQVAPRSWPADQPLTVDGWLHTGDVGRFDEAGRLVVVDRLKDVIITGGENVSSREVEDVLSTHPAVEHVAVVGVPDPHWGEAVCAVVVTRSEEDPAALIEHVRARLAGFKRPRHVLFRTALPLTTNGKVDKAAVRRYARESLSTTEISSPNS